MLRFEEVYVEVILKLMPELIVEIQQVARCLLEILDEVVFGSAHHCVGDVAEHIPKISIISTQVRGRKKDDPIGCRSNGGILVIHLGLDQSLRVTALVIWTMIQVQVLFFKET